LNVHRTLRQRGRITVELKEEPEAVETKLSLSIFDDDDDSEEGQMVDCDGGREGGSERSFMAKNKYKYLMDDVSGKVFEKPPEGTVIEDLLSDGSVLKNVSLYNLNRSYLAELWEYWVYELYRVHLLFFQMIRKGQGDLIPENCKVFVQYIIVTDGPISHEIDSTLTPGRCRPEAIDLRNPSVIPGFYVALRSMSLFEVAKFMIRYDQAYGANGCLPRVPPWTDVICTMEVISFLDEEQLKTVEHMDPPDRLALPFSKILEYSSQKKDEGSIQFKLKDFAGAKRAYYQAAKVLEEYPVTDESESDEKSSLLFTLFNNLAACCLKLEKWEHASVACLKGLQCSSSVASQSAKLLYRYFHDAIELVFRFRMMS